MDRQTDHARASAMAKISGMEMLPGPPRAMVVNKFPVSV
jgi:hypothetical protein